MPHDSIEEFSIKRDNSPGPNGIELYRTAFGTQPPVSLINSAGKYCCFERLDCILKARVSRGEPVTDWNEISRAVFDNWASDW